MKHFERYWTSDDGLRLYGRDYPGPSPEAPVLLCLPGLTRNSKDFEALALSLCQRWRVLCPDQRGRGHSARDSDPGRYRPDRYCADMLALLDGLDIERVGLIGTSLGGLMAMMLVAMRPQAIQAVVLNDVGPEFDPAGIARISAYLTQPSAPCSLDEALARIAGINAGVFPDYGPADWLALAQQTCVVEDGRVVLDYDPAIAQGLANGSATPDLWPLFGLLAGRPVLALRGALSDLLSAATLARMAERLPGLETLEVPDRGHAPTLDEPLVRERLLDFLANAYG
jgi:pimeloyl-ACP methyl ester carboxylesterase